MDYVINWLLNSEPYVEYNTKKYLLNEKLDYEQIGCWESKIIQNQKVETFLKDLLDWPGYPLKRHNDAAHLIHKLVFLVDIGLTKRNSLLEQISQRIFSNQSEEGLFQIIANIPTHFGGSGNDEFLWMLCDAPSILYSLQKMGWSDDNRINVGLEYITNLIEDFGWPCVTTPKLKGKFRGPGKKKDPCPYANLIVLKALQQHPKWKESEECKIGAEVLLNLWEQRKEKKAYLFGMGTDFNKLKLPFIWYDILHCTEVLTQFNWLRKDERLIQMVEIIKSKGDDKGLFTAESVWNAWKGWDFAQKKEPSPWITFMTYRILDRMK